MTVRNWIAAGIEAVLWYSFLYYFLYAIKTPNINLIHSAFILLLIMYSASIMCPLLREMDAWKRLWKR